MVKKNISSDKFGLALSYLLLGEFSGLALEACHDEMAIVSMEGSTLQETVFAWLRSLFVGLPTASAKGPEAERCKTDRLASGLAGAVFSSSDRLSSTHLALAPRGPQYPGRLA